MVRGALDSPNGAADMQSTLQNNTASPGRGILVNEKPRGCKKRSLHNFYCFYITIYFISSSFENVINLNYLNALFLGYWSLCY